VSMHFFRGVLEEGGSVTDVDGKRVGLRRLQATECGSGPGGLITSSRRSLLGARCAAAGKAVTQEAGMVRHCPQAAKEASSAWAPEEEQGKGTSPLFQPARAC
jgi:hypothetical protein